VPHVEPELQFRRTGAHRVLAAQGGAMGFPPPRVSVMR
jgi:hypothetical protein